MTDDGDIIDLRPYLDPLFADSRDIFAVHGVSGTTARYGMQVFRLLHGFKAQRGMLAAVRGGDGPLELVFVLDTGKDPARLEIPGAAEAAVRLPWPDARVRHSEDDGGWISVHLGEARGDVYHLLLLDVEGMGLLQDQDARRDLLFLAGECSGLLMERELPVYDE